MSGKKVVLIILLASALGILGCFAFIYGFLWIAFNW